jgi:branched-subunit amino acid aminotransferase/4-amino-4-deoxychorismate lyase
VLSELAGRLQIPLVERVVNPADFSLCDEAFAASTPNCLLPVTRFNGRPIGNGKPGAQFRRFLAAWNELVEFDIAVQAQRFAHR